MHKLILSVSQQSVKTSYKPFRCILLLLLLCFHTLVARAHPFGYIENDVPNVNAGMDMSVSSPVMSITLTGSASDADGTIANYSWTKVSGPDAVTISQPDAATTTVTGLVQGIFLFRLTVTDNEGGSAYNDVPVTVKAAAAANAGKDTLIYKNQTRPDSILLNGSLSIGTVFHWEQVSGPTVTNIVIPDSVTTWVTGKLAEGFYSFKVTVDAEASDTVTVFIRDWQKKGVYPCRDGYDTTAKKGGLKIILEPNYKGTYIKPDGTSGTWNQWNYITNVRGYVQTTKKLTLSGGDTLLLEGADSTVLIELGGFGGDKGCPVYVMPRTKPVRIRGTGSFFRIATRDSNAVQYVVVDGTALRSAGYPYGFLLDNSNLGYAGNGPFNGGWLANFTLKGLRSTKTNALKIKLDPTAYLFSRYDKFVQRNIRITDNWIDSSSVEGMYIGSTASDGGQLSNPYGPPPRMESVEISNNIVTNCAWDGIQLANAKNGCVIRHNLVFKAGTANMPSQRAGILMGGNTTGVVDSNIIINSKGNGIQVFGYGDIHVYDNIIDSINGGKGDQDGIYQSFIVFNSEPVVDPLRVYNYNNLICRAERNMIRIANTNGRMLPGRTHHNTFIHPTATNANGLIVTYAKDVLDNNSIVSNFPYKLNTVKTQGADMAICMTQEDTTLTFMNVKTTLCWLFKRLGGVSAANIPPVVNAGNDTYITSPADSVLLNGSAVDEDGSVKTYQWRKVTGPEGELFQTPIQSQTLVKNLIPGTYHFELAATDNGNKAGFDTVIIKVNTPPAVNAGTDKVITLPATSSVLTGSAADDGTVTSVSWIKLSGPASFQLQNASALQTTVESLVAGVYVFELRVTDEMNAQAADTVMLTVNMPPAVSAGPDQQLTLPANTVTLSGSGTDADGTITAFSWTKVSGPSQGSISTPSTATTTVTTLAAGTYIFRLTVTDNNGAVASDEVAVMVNNAPAVNTAKYINVNIYDGTNPYVNSAWNNWSIRTKTANNVTLTNIKYADGSASAMNATLSNSTSIADNGATYGSGMAPAPVLRYTSYHTNNRTLTLKGLSTTKKYSIELYASRNVSGSATVFTVNGLSQTISTYNNLTTKATFTNLSANTSGQLVISIAKSGSFNCLNGFAIAETSINSAALTSITSLKTTEKEQGSAKDYVSVFPNPVTNKVVLQLANNKNGVVAVQIISASGNIIYECHQVKEGRESTYILPAGNLAAGVYFIKVQVGNWQTVSSFIKL